MASVDSIETPQEKALYQAFKRFDVNGDGRIQHEEFHKLMASLGKFTTSEIKRLFKEADTDNSGSVDWREFIRWVCSGAATRSMAASSKETFNHFLMSEQIQEAGFIESTNVNRHVLDAIRQQESEGKRRTPFSKGKKQELAKNPDGLDLGIEKDYKGFRLEIPCTRDGAIALMKHYLNAGDTDPLHPKYVQYLTTEFTTQYKARHPQPVVQLETPKGGRLIMVGDTHGQLADVLHIFHQMGPPGPLNRYIFNGDVADRGCMAVEIFMILFSFFLSDPDCLVINRGNHENEDMNALDADSGGGFSDEVLDKYGLIAYRRFTSAFKVLSLCAVVEKEVFVVHGGLSRVKSLTLDYINSIDIHSCTAPHPQSTNTKDNVFSDLLWSDPTDQPGKFKSERGIGLKFGPDLTTKFCMVNRLRFIVRSHQLPDDGRGYYKQHEGRCVTIFSASNYCGNGGNYGAVLVLTSEAFPRYEIFEHFAAPLEELRRVINSEAQEDLIKKGQEAQKKGEDAASAGRWEKELQKMIIAVIEKKPVLWAHAVDAKLEPFLPLDTWAELMSELVEGSMSWAKAAKDWELADANGMVDFGGFLRRWTVRLDSEQYNSFLLKAVTVVYHAILALDMDLEKTFKYFDQDGDGTVDIQELRQVFGMFDLGLTTTQVDRVCGQIFEQVISTKAKPDSGHKSSKQQSRIAVNEFLKSFAIIYKQADGCTHSDKIDHTILECLSSIAQLILKTPADKLVYDIEQAANLQTVLRAKRSTSPEKEKLKKPRKDDKRFLSSAGDIGESMSKMISLFKAMDVSGDGQLQLEEFVCGLQMIPGINTIQFNGKPMDRAALMILAKAIDSSGNGTINYLEFLQAFQADSSSNTDIVDALAEDITTVLFRHRSPVRLGCQYLDEEGIGKVRGHDFQTVLQGVNSALSKPERTLTGQQISLLVESMVLESEDGPIVDYDAFLRAFVIIDRKKGNEVVKKYT